MNIQMINVGTNPNDGTGDNLRSAFQKVNNNFQNLNDSKANTDHTHDLVTTGRPGFMSPTDKQKLDGLSNYSHPTDDGYKHVPANGTNNNKKVLKSTDVAGNYIWDFVDYSEIRNTPGFGSQVAEFEASSGQTTVTCSSFSKLQEKPFVFVNGLLVSPSDYSVDISEKKITFNNALNNKDKVVVYG